MSEKPMISDEMIEEAARAIRDGLLTPECVLGVPHRKQAPCDLKTCDCWRPYTVEARLAIEAVLPSLRKQVLEECAQVADDMRRKYGDPQGKITDQVNSAYSNGAWDQGVRIASAIRSLIEKPSP